MNTDKIYAEKIASEYAPKKTSKVNALKKLDKKAKVPAEVFAYTFGIISTLLFGTGMCLAMKVIGNGSAIMMGLGIFIGIIAMVLMSVNYLIYKKMLEKGKNKYASDIIELAKQITDEE